MGVSWNRQRWQSILEFGDKLNYFKLKDSKVLVNDGSDLSLEILGKLACLKKNWYQAGLTPPDLQAKANNCEIPASEIAEYALYLCEQKEWVSVNGFYFASLIVKNAGKTLGEYLTKNKEISVAEVRELWKTSRKYAVPLLEYFDRRHFTRRLGNKRILYR